MMISCQLTEVIDETPLEENINPHFPVHELNDGETELLQLNRKLDKHFTRLHKYAQFNGNVLIARRGNILYSGSFGVQDIETKKPLNIHSVFQIASVSKTFTAMATMLLVEDKKLKLDQTLEDFFPEFPYSKITVADLLTHRSGLPNYLYATEKLWENDGLKSNQDLLNYLIEHQPTTQGLPNRFFAYNNTNYALLALIIEQASGMTFQSFLQTRIFEPLQMDDTYIFSSTDSIIPKNNLTIGYLQRGVPDQLVPADGIVGDKNIYSTVYDLLRWERAQSNNHLFKQSTLDSVSKGRSYEKPGRKNYGYGWRILENPTGPIIYHNGWWHGYTAVFSRNPQDETVIIILSNIFNRATYRIQAVWDILYQENYLDGEDNG